MRSLYYDTCDCQAYIDKIVGQPARIKLRVRAYASQPDANSPIRVELKTRQGSLVKKYSTLLELDRYQRWRRAPDRVSAADPVLIEFRRLCLLRLLQPNVLVDYHRQAWQAKDDPKLRITFDRNLRYAAANILFPHSPHFRPANNRGVLLEIKTTAQPPAWLRKILASLELPSCPHSKYANGVEQSLISRFG